MIRDLILAGLAALVAFRGAGGVAVDALLARRRRLAPDAPDEEGVGLEA